MSVVLLVGPWAGRRYDPVAALAVAAAAMTLWEPQVLGDAGFQLSFAAMMGLALVSPHFEAAAEWLRVPRILSVPISAGLGAQVGTVPLILLLTGQVSVVSPFATLTADIALLPLMITGIAAGVVGALAPFAWVAALLGMGVWPFAAWMLWWVQAWAALPWATIQVGDISVGWVALYYLLLGSILALSKVGPPPRWHGLRLRPLAFSALALWAGLVGVMFVR